MSLRSPLARARGLGSAKEGLGHWIAQRVTAIALVPLSIWFIISVIGLAGSHYEQFQAWLAVPGNTALMLLLLFAVFHHAQIGCQVVIEDYIHGRGARLAAILLVKLTSILLGVFAAVAVLRAALVGG
ncbi:MAG TPA: succinate dehydrogenase, hydrophobic membrane anchor protein [Magnetospirillaceae bacterium]|nr:succinate dehydrogenase, hydrophobic membrane anchor protein [Magnetospirillaceae bacterium]